MRRPRPLYDFGRGRRGHSGLAYAIVLAMVTVIGITAIAEVGQSVRAVMRDTDAAMRRANAPELSPPQFDAITDHPPGEPAISEPMTVSDFTGTRSAAVMGEADPALSIDGGAWSEHTTIAAGDRVRIRLAGADTPDTR